MCRNERSKGKPYIHVHTFLSDSTFSNLHEPKRKERKIAPLNSPDESICNMTQIYDHTKVWAERRKKEQIPSERKPHVRSIHSTHGYAHVCKYVQSVRRDSERDAKSRFEVRACLSIATQPLFFSRPVRTKNSFARFVCFFILFHFNSRS